ncbi:rubredoxin [Anthocerotibacter panamensis]|uniref:rubredoxin n=1 Tax=Anthocerotibacter panamensis TaxID=2857077 RepID=UPI001C408BBA|nr:rubredoxin [Anthocerotibacter panamensis]
MDGPTPDPKTLDRGECNVCGYIYEPVDGDPPRGIKSGTSYDSLPVTWHCPNCNAPLERFKRIGPRSGTLAGFEENASLGIGVNTLNPQVKNLLIFGVLALGFLFLMSFYFMGQ